MTTQDKPAPTETILTAHDIKCLEITECWLKNNRIDGDIPKDAKIEKIRFVYWGDATMAYITLSNAVETHLKIHHPKPTDGAFA